jgi:hypothetical protein
MYDKKIRSDIICISEVLWEDSYHQDTLQRCEIIPSIDGNVDVRRFSAKRLVRVVFEPFLRSRNEDIF